MILLHSSAIQLWQYLQYLFIAQESIHERGIYMVPGDVDRAVGALGGHRAKFDAWIGDQESMDVAFQVGIMIVLRVKLGHQGIHCMGGTVSCMTGEQACTAFIQSKSAHHHGVAAEGD